ncbi:trem-like transcript 2 protein [Saccopteryx leptura]|uniref:trem-like transcript 2 protein n=1 Tax=Saccopteryx leptura TaxID=249018 RepID=UPI00339C5FC2
MAPTLLLLLSLLWVQGCGSGAPAESVYAKLQHFEGETLSVQCSYKGRKKHVEGKVWCKIRRKKCEPGFTRVWAQGPRYLLQDDAQARVVNITMVALRRQDSGRYWCMRNSSGTLYPLMGFQLDVSPVPTTERDTSLTQLANILKSGIVVTTGQASTSGSDAPVTTSVRMFTPGVLTLARLLPSAASGIIGLSSMTDYSFTGPSKLGPRRTKGPQTVTAAPSNARASSAGTVPISTKTRHQDSSPAVLVGALTLLSVSVAVMMVYGFWKKRHMGSYSVCRDPPGRPEPPWKPARFKATYRVGELIPEGHPEAVGAVKMGTYLDRSQGGG